MSEGDGETGKVAQDKLEPPSQHPDNSLLQHHEREATWSYSPLGREGQKPVHLGTRFSTNYRVNDGQGNIPGVPPLYP